MKFNLVIFVFRKISGGFSVENKRDTLSGILVERSADG